MKKRNTEDLIRRLIENRISKEELDVFLEGMDDEETTEIYEAYLRNHFDRMMNEHALEQKNNKTPINKDEAS
ncbi:MAG TPA: hypothetical protein VK014_07380 [Cyclobacteriaceae bacterium]|nr:hypothetical protein [Cyclobacteriaceae bacterium]